MPCGLARRVAQRIEAEAVGLRQAWVRELFVAFCGWDALRRQRGSMARHIGEYAQFFAVMDRHCGKVADVHQTSLLEQHGAEGLRRAHQAVRFLVGRLALPWEAATAAQVVEGGRVATTVAAAAGQAWAADLDAYRLHLSKGRALAPATTRIYLAAAAELLRHAGVERASGLTQAHVARHMRRTPGQAANLRRFLSWVGDTWGKAFSHKPKRSMPPRRREKATLRKASHLMARLEGIQDPREGRAMLAAAIAVLHHLPLAKVLALHREEVALEQGRVVLWPAAEVVELAQPLAAALARFTAGDGRFPFPGRNSAQPLTASAVRHHLRR